MKTTIFTFLSSTISLFALCLLSTHCRSIPYVGSTAQTPFMKQNDKLVVGGDVVAAYEGRHGSIEPYAIAGGRLHLAAQPVEHLVVAGSATLTRESTEAEAMAGFNAEGFELYAGYGKSLVRGSSYSKVYQYDSDIDRLFFQGGILKSFGIFDLGGYSRIAFTGGSRTEVATGASPSARFGQPVLEAGPLLRHHINPVFIDLKAAVIVGLKEIYAPPWVFSAGMGFQLF